MRFDLRISWIALGTLLALGLAQPCAAKVSKERPAGQESTSGRQEPTPPADDTKENVTEHPEGKPNTGPGKQEPDKPPPQANPPRPSPPASGGGVDKKNKVSFQDLAKGNLQNLDVAIALARKTGAITEGPDKTAHDPFSAKRTAFDERVKAAKDDKAWAALATDAAATLSDVLKTIAANSSSTSASAVRATTDVADRVDVTALSSRSKLALYLAVLSLAVSALGLGGGLLLAGWKVKKVLIEAGLL